MRDTLKVIDALLKVDTPNGVSWHRYNGDGYGEHADGAPFDGVGEGRAWPLLTGERGHFELAAGNDPLPYLESMAAMSGRGGMLPEQVWDSKAIPCSGTQSRAAQRVGHAVGLGARRIHQIVGIAPTGSSH